MKSSETSLAVAICVWIYTGLATLLLISFMFSAWARVYVLEISAVALAASLLLVPAFAYMKARALMDKNREDEGAFYA